MHVLAVSQLAKSSEIWVELTLLWVKDDAALSVGLKRTVLSRSARLQPAICRAGAADMLNDHLHDPSSRLPFTSWHFSVAFYHSINTYQYEDVL
jgi:hypothetical protein